MPRLPSPHRPRKSGAVRGPVICIAARTPRRSSAVGGHGAIDPLYVRLAFRTRFFGRGRKSCASPDARPKAPRLARPSEEASDGGAGCTRPNRRSHRVRSEASSPSLLSLGVWSCSGQIVEGLDASLVFSVDYALVCITALLASGLTLVSGFGLGTILMPAFAVFFPLPAAIAATAIVHLANNGFKLALVGRHADRATLLRFGVPAVLASFAGAALLALLENAAPLAAYSIGTHTCRVTIVKLVIAAIMLGFAALEVSPRFSKLEFDRRYQPLGGVLSGFFGGLSGHQGSLRSAFLVRAGLSKESFIATGCVVAVMVDVARLLVYGVDAWRAHAQQARAEGVGFGLIAAACISAFAGAYLGAKLVRKITIEAVRVMVAGMLAIIAILLGTGII